MLLIIAAWFIVKIPAVQRYIVQKVAKNLSEKLHTEVSVKDVDFSLFNKMNLRGVLVRDLQKDTLFFSGTASVRITDWFFWKDNVTLHYAGLENTVINLQRTDSVWNYQFLVDYFAGPPKKDTSSSKGGLQLDLKDIHIKNLRLNQLDKWVGKDLRVSVQGADIAIDSFNTGSKQASIKSVVLDAPFFYQRNYTGQRDIRGIVSQPSAPSAITIPSAYRWNKGNWLIQVGSISIKNGAFQNEKETERAPYTDRFDGQHLAFNNINATLKNIQWKQDTISTQITLAAKEKSGLDVKQLSANMRFTPVIMEFNKLDLNVNNSYLKNYYSMSYENFNADMDDFIHSVTLKGKFKESKVSSDDIAIFAPALKNWNRVFLLDGDASGTIDNLAMRNIAVTSGTTKIEGDLALRGLPNINETFIDYRGKNLQTNYNDLITFIPSLQQVQQPALSKLGAINYKGNFTGFINDFVTYGTLNTALGTVKADVNLKLHTGKPAVYEGKISTTQFQLGEFIKLSKIGTIAFDGSIKGSGFTAADVHTGFDGSIRSIQYDGYNYQNIQVKGDFKNKLFAGTASMNDPNLQFDNLNGTIDFSGTEPRFKFDAFLAKAQLQQLRLTRDNFSLNGRFSLDFTGNNIDNFLGSARIYSATLQHNGQRLSFDSLTLGSAVLNNQKRLTLQSNEADAIISGQFKIAELPNAFTKLLSKYYPAYIKAPKGAVSNQDFSFDIRTKNINEYLQIIDKKMVGGNNAVINGRINVAANILEVNGDIPEFGYDGKMFTGITIAGTGNGDTLATTIGIQDIAINDSLHFPGTQLVVKSHNDLSDVAITTTATKTLSSAELNARVQTLSDGVNIHFYPSSLIVNDKKWKLEKDGELTIRKKTLNASGIKFTEGNQEITLFTDYGEEGETPALIAKLKKVNIEDITPLLFKKPHLEGILDGELVVKDPFGKQEIEFKSGGGITNLQVDNNPLGDIEMEDVAYLSNGVVRYKGRIKGEQNRIAFAGTYNIKDSLSPNQLNTNLEVERIDLAFLQPYLNGIFSDMKGIATGSVKLYGNKRNQFTTGTMQITDASLMVNYTKCRYKFTNETIILNENEIDFGNLQLKDTLNNTATLSGSLYHRFFQDFEFDNIRLNTGRMLLLNTTRRDNDQFYGKVIGNASMSLDGPISNMKMDIVGGPSSSITDSNHIYLPGGSGRETGDLGYVEMVQFGSKVQNDLAKEGTNLNINMQVTATKECKVDVILDEVTGDVIKGEGSGVLSIRVGTTQTPEIRGRYLINGGSYEFNFQTYLKRFFTLRRGGTINWTGDPYEAEIDISAEYEANNVDYAVISPNTKQRSQLLIISHLTKTIKKPEISFTFNLPANVGFTDEFVVRKRLEDFKNDATEMNKQVSSLLIFNTFVGTGQNFFGGNTTTNFVANTVGQIVSNLLTNSFSRFLQRTLNDPNINSYFDITPSFDLRGSVNQIQAAGRFGLIKNYLNGRLIVSIGGNVDYNNPYLLGTGRSTNLLITPDFSAEWLLTRDGKIRVVGFRRTSIDYAVGQRNRQGISLSYKKDFDKKRKKKPAPASAEKEL